MTMHDQRSVPLWRVGICLVGFLAAAVLWSGLRGLLREADLPGTVAEGAAGLLYVGAVLALVIGLRRGLDRRSLGSMGLSRPRAAHLLTGALVAAGTVAVVVGVGVLAGVSTVAVVAVGEPGFRPVLDAALATVVTMGAVAVAEEAVFRGYVLQGLAERWPLWAATAASGFAFGGMHLFGVTTVSGAGAMALSAMTVTVLLVVARVVTGAIWWAVGWHAAWNASSAYLGLYGPRPHPIQVSLEGPRWLVGPPGLFEAGVLVIAANAVVVGLALVLVARRGRAIGWGRRLTGDCDPALGPQGTAGAA